MLANISGTARGGPIRTAARMRPEPAAWGADPQNPVSAGRGSQTELRQEGNPRLPGGICYGG